jgi:hypothetical protein
MERTKFLNKLLIKKTLTLTSALSFILASTLALTFVFSLREVRLKIGDYYFKQGKFDQAVNWYQTQQR